MPDRPDLFDDMARMPEDDDPRDPRGTRGTSGGRGMRHGRVVRPHPMPCPPLGILMAYADEADTSITRRRRERIREHVRRCDICHAHLVRGFDEMVDGVHEILKDAYELNQAALRARESRFRSALHTQIKLTALPLGSRWPTGRWLAAAASVAAIVTCLLLFRPAVAVIHAEELITRAIEYERTHAVGSRQRIRQSLHSGLFTLARSVPAVTDVSRVTGISGVTGASRILPFSSIRDVVDGAYAVETLPSNMRERDAHLALARVFAQHHFEWRKPFCLTCFRAWHGSLSRKRDTVTLTGDMVLLRTTTTEGNLREVTLTFHRDSYRIVRQTFTFEGLGRVEFEELERREAMPSASAPTDRRASAAESQGAVNADASRRSTIVTSRQPAAGDIGRAAKRRLGLSRWLERTFPKSASDARMEFLPNLEQRAASVLQHLIVLQRLENLDSSAKMKNATEVERLELRQRIELEYQTMRTHLHALEEHLDLLVGTGTRVMESRTPLPDDWQRRATEALPHATRLEYRLQRLFTRDDLPPEETRVDRPQSVRATFEALWESIHGDQHD